MSTQKPGVHVRLLRLRFIFSNNLEMNTDVRSTSLRFSRLGWVVLWGMAQWASE